MVPPVEEGPALTPDGSRRVLRGTEKTGQDPEESAADHPLREDVTDSGTPRDIGTQRTGHRARIYAPPPSACQTSITQSDSGFGSTATYIDSSKARIAALSVPAASTSMLSADGYMRRHGAEGSNGVSSNNGRSFTTIWRKT